MKSSSSLFSIIVLAAVADAVEKLLADEPLRTEMRCYLMSEPKGNTSEIHKFYDLLES